jgi:hypothetical protein
VGSDVLLKSRDLIHMIDFCHSAALVADTILVTLPIVNLRDLRSYPVVRKRLQIIFAASSVMTFASISMAIANIFHNFFGFHMAGQIEVGLSSSTSYCPSQKPSFYLLRPLRAGYLSSYAAPTSSSRPSVEDSAKILT